MLIVNLDSSVDVLLAIRLNKRGIFKNRVNQSNGFCHKLVRCAVQLIGISAETPKLCHEQIQFQIKIFQLEQVAVKYIPIQLQLDLLNPWLVLDSHWDEYRLAVVWRYDIWLISSKRFLRVSWKIPRKMSNENTPALSCLLYQF